MVKGPKFIVNKATTLRVILSIGLLATIAKANPPVSSQTSAPTVGDSVGTASGWEEAVKQINAGAGEHQQIEERNKTPDITPAERQANAARQSAIVEQLDRNATRFPDNPVVQGAAAGAALRVNQPEKARIYADRWESLAEPDSPEWAKAVNTGGLAALETGDFKKAEAAARRVLDKFPKDQAARGLLHSAQGRAKAVTATAAPDRPVLPPAPPPKPGSNPYNDPGWNEYADRVARARNLNSLATSRLMMRDGNEAKRLALEAQALEPGIGRSYLLEARAWGILGDLAQALDRMGRAIELLAKEGGNPLADAYTDRAKIHNALKKRDAAVKDADAALQINPNSAQAHRQRGAALQSLGQIEAAKAALRRAAELDGGGSDGVDYYGQSEPAAPARDRENALHQAWTKFLGKVGGSFNLFMGTMGALFVLFSGYVFWFAKEGSVGGRVRGFFTPAPAADKVIGGGRYEIREILGQGGMGTVWLAWDRQLERFVAVKSMNADLLPNEDLRQRFVKEAMLVAQLRHPNIGDVYAFCEEPAGLYIVFAYVKGRTIHDLLNETPGRRLEHAYALELGLGIAKAIDYAHSQGVIHRDLKPGNVMIDEHGVVKVMDFGIARRLDNAQTTMTQISVGTPAYMAPEQAWGVVTRQSDQYSFGVMMYEKLTGCRPFNGMDAQHDKLEGRFTPPSQLLPSLAPAVDEVFKVVLHPDYKQRHESGVKFWETLKAAMSLSPSPGQ